MTVNTNGNAVPVPTNIPLTHEAAQAVVRIDAAHRILELWNLHGQSNPAHAFGVSAVHDMFPALGAALDQLCDAYGAPRP